MNFWKYMFLETLVCGKKHKSHQPNLQWCWKGSEADLPPERQVCQAWHSQEQRQISPLSDEEASGWQQYGTQHIRIIQAQIGEENSRKTSQDLWAWKRDCWVSEQAESLFVQSHYLPWWYDSYPAQTQTRSSVSDWCQLGRRVPGRQARMGRRPTQPWRHLAWHSHQRVHSSCQTLRNVRKHKQCPSRPNWQKAIVAC